ncbi:MAG: hypothetical protein K9J78_00840 [Polynucleobacter sp.]|nr:hypothetical protein [Polynucleobacter sp.]
MRHNVDCNNTDVAATPWEASSTPVWGIEPASTTDQPFEQDRTPGPRHENGWCWRESLDPLA